MWDGVSDAFIVFKPDNICDDVAYVVENDLILSAVGKVLQDINNVDIVYEAKINKYQLPEPDQNFVQVELENGTKYTCNLLVSECVALLNKYILYLLFVLVHYYYIRCELIT